MKWRPIADMPKCLSEIIAYCCHDADPYYSADEGLTAYGAACDAFVHASDGVHILERIPEYTDGSYDCGYTTYPAYWAVKGSDGEVAANPTHWMPVPKNPKEN